MYKKLPPPFYNEDELKFDKNLLNMERYLTVEGYAKAELSGLYKVTDPHDIKTVSAYFLTSQYLIDAYRKQKIYNGILINSIEHYHSHIVRNSWGYESEYSDKLTDLDKDIAEGFFRIRYTYKDESQERKETFFLVATGNSETKDDYYIATDSVRKEMVKFAKKVIKKSKKRTINKGVYTVETHNDKFYYVKKPVKEINQNPLITPAWETLNKDINFFFNNISVFSTFNQTPNRKVLLAGPQGTGKSSMAYAIAKEYQKNMAVVFTTNIKHAGFHLKTSAKKSLPTILVLEDADATFQESSSYNGSSILNILDGIDMPHNKEGFYMIMTTNYPERIEDRIKKRPGRVDKIITVNTLHDEYALRCAAAYMDALMDDKNRPNATTLDNSYKKIFDGLSGAQIKDLITATRIYMTQNQIDEVTIPVFEEVREQIKDSLKSLDDIEKDLNENFQTKGSFGFNQGRSSY